MKRFLIVPVCLLVFVFCLVSCDLGKAHATPKQLTVVFNPNYDESGEEAVVQMFSKNQLIALKKNTFERTGFSFAGWSTERTGRSGHEQFVDEEIVRLADNLVLYAVWEENDYTILFNAKGGQLSEKGKTVKYEERVVLPSPVKSGELFGGWYKSEDYNADDALPGVVSKLAPRGNVDVYARWIEPSKAGTITYYANFSGSTSAPVQQTMEKGSCEKLIPNEFARTGYVFDRWTVVTGTVFYENEAEVVFEDNAALYATWKPITYRVILHADNGTGDAVILNDVAYDTQDRLPANKFVRKDYKFAGWARKSQSDTVLYEDMAEAGALSTVQGDVVELYAVWEVVGIKSIVVKQAPYSLSFLYGTIPDLDGLEVEVIYADNTKVILDENTIDRYTFDSVQAGKNRKMSVWYNDIEVEAADFEILPKPVRLNWSDSVTEFRYNGSSQNPVPKVGGVLPGDSCAVTQFSGAGTTVGQYTVTVMGLSNSNYTLPSENLSCTYSIIPGFIEVVKPEAVVDLEYNGQDQQLIIPGSTNCGKMVYCLGDGNWTDSVSSIVGKGIGTYYVFWEIQDAEDENYCFESEEDMYGVVYVMLSDDILFVNSPVANVLTYNGEAQDLITSGTVSESSDAYYEYSTGSDYGREIPQGKDTGHYTVHWRLVYDSNLNTLNSGAKVRGDIEIDIQPKELEIAWNKSEFVYDGKAQKPSAVISGGVLPGESCGLSVSVEGFANGAVNASNNAYVALATVDNPNYRIADSTKTHEFMINKKDLTVSWSGLGPFTYTGSSQAPVPTVSGLISGDNCVALVDGQQVNASDTPYTATVRLDGSKSDNYRIVFGATCQFMIYKKPVNVTWTDTELVYNGQLQGPTPHVDAFEQGFPSCVLTIEGKKRNVNSSADYTATLKLEGTNAENYEILSGETCDYAILKKGLTVNWTNPGPFVYNGKKQAPTAEVLGVVSGDKCNLQVMGSSIAATDYGSFETATAFLVGDDAQNYSIASGYSIEYKIEKKPVILTWSTNTSFVYNGTNQAPVATLRGVLDGDTCSVFVSGKKSDVGNYSASAMLAGSGSKNYIFAPGTLTDTEFEIKPIEVELSWGSVEWTYDGVARAPAANVANLVEGDTVNVIVSGASESVGIHTATAVNLTGSSSSNYTLPAGQTKSFTILKAPGESMPDLKMIPDGSRTGLNAFVTYEYLDKNGKWVSFTQEDTVKIDGRFSDTRCEEGSITLRRAADKNHTAGPSRTYDFFVGDGVLPGGYFSVGPGKRVLFSTGNLVAHYDPASPSLSVQGVDLKNPSLSAIKVQTILGKGVGVEWTIAKKQYQFVGLLGNKFNNPSGEYLVDLFGWSADGNPETAFGLSDIAGESHSDPYRDIPISDYWKTDYYYGGNFVDWGENKVSGWPVWRSLSYDEWYYLLYSRLHASDKFGFAVIKNVGGYVSVAGMVILPDGWATPNGLSAFVARSAGLENEQYYRSNVYTAEQWAKMEKAGAVFLPAAGWRNQNYSAINSADNPNAPYFEGNYWADTVASGRANDNKQHYLRFVAGVEKLFYEDDLIWKGKSVRLVTDYVVYDANGIR